MVSRARLLFFTLTAAIAIHAMPSSAHAQITLDTTPSREPLVAVPASLPQQDSADDRPCFTLDGRMMYFGSRRVSKDSWRVADNSNPNWKWDSDLWYRILTDSGWSAPINVGPPINNSAAQLNPTISPRGDVLYYVGGGPVLWMARMVHEIPHPAVDAKPKTKPRKSRGNKGVEIPTVVDSTKSPKFLQPTPVGGMLNAIYNNRQWVQNLFKDSILRVVEQEMLPDSDLKTRAPDAWNLHHTERLVEHYKTQMAVDFATTIRCESTISPDGKAAIISENFGKRGSYGMDGEGGEDLWLVTIDPKRGWDTVKYLGGHVNSEYDETYPFLAADGATLYFTSNRPCRTCANGTWGAQDLYRTQLTSTGWSDPVPLGPPFNSSKDDYGFSIGPDGKTAYFVSNRTGKSRLYQVSLTPADSNIAPKPVVVLQGTVTDAKTHKPLAAEVFVDDLTAAQSTQSVFSDSITGAYMLAAQRGHRFGVQAVAPGHLPRSERFTVPQEGSFDRTKLDLELAPAEIGAKLEFKNVYFEFGKADLLPESKLELSRVVKFLVKSNKTTLEIAGHTDDVGTAEANQTLSEARAQAVLDFLVSIGINRSRMKAVGYGKTRPRVRGTSEDARAQNRRVEMTITSESD